MSFYQNIRSTLLTYKYLISISKDPDLLEKINLRQCTFLNNVLKSFYTMVYIVKTLDGDIVAICFSKSHCTMFIDDQQFKYKIEVSCNLEFTPDNVDKFFIDA